MSQDFQEEAESLWEVERQADTLPALAGLGLLSVVIASHGKGSVAMRYFEDIADMSRRMRLFDVTDRLTAAEFKTLPVEVQMATAQAAWAAYNHLW